MHVVLTRIEPGCVPPVEGELDESEGEDEEADERRGERREEAEPEPIVDPVVGEGAAFGCGRISIVCRCLMMSCFIHNLTY